MDRILQKLSEMILDEVINGTLDQGRNCMIIYEEPQSNKVFEHAIDTFKNLDGVVDSLYDKTQNYKKTYLSWAAGGCVFFRLHVSVCQLFFDEAMKQSIYRENPNNPKTDKCIFHQFVQIHLKFIN